MQPDSHKGIQESIKDFFLKIDNVCFVYLFGSFVTEDIYRDIDIAVYMDPKPDLITQGKMQAKLQRLLQGTDIDILLLNSLPEKKPSLVHQILSGGKLLTNNKPRLHKEYKSKALRYYLDTAYLRTQMEQAFRDRLKSGAFGVRDYE